MCYKLVTSFGVYWFTGLFNNKDYGAITMGIQVKLIPDERNVFGDVIFDLNGVCKKQKQSFQCHGFFSF